MKKYTLRIVARSDGWTGYNGRFVAEYDPTYHLANGEYDGGLLTTTEDPRQAMIFNDPQEALEKWRQPAGCSCHGTRADGKLNRPLTAYTVVVD